MTPVANAGPAPAAGPILYLRAVAAGRLDLTALRIVPDGVEAGALTSAFGTVAPERVAARCGAQVWRYRFSVPTRADAWYALEGRRYGVAADLDGDLRLAYVSCNGQEHGDEARPQAARNAMWERLGDRHRKAPFHLLLHGGDQIYADELLAAHPAAERWPALARPALGEAACAGLREALRDAFFRRYARQYAQDAFAAIAAHVPSLAMWDDHDICDGWGSLAPGQLDSVVGRTLFAVAREMFLLFQLGLRGDEMAPLGLDREGVSLSWCAALPGLTLVAPDLRSERRPDRVLGPAGWRALRAALDAAAPGRILVLSSVPALGPRLSLVERLMGLTPWMERYEDDLRDQWQSHAHRQEWRAFLRALLTAHERPGRNVTVLSGEIHLATRATMASAAGPLHQLVASGIAHPAPPVAYAAGLGALAALGEAPLAGHPIRIAPLPGARRRYTAERNFLVLERIGGAWRAVWERERSGPTPPLAI